MAFNNNITILISVFILFVCFTTLCQLVLFLSSHSPLKYKHPSLKNSEHFASSDYLNPSKERHQKESHAKKSKVWTDIDESVWFQVLRNTCLLLIFALQHSIQNRKFVKDFLNNVGLGLLERLFYNFGSCLTLQILMWYWQPIYYVTIWEISTSENSFMWWLFTSIHSIAWLIIYSGCFIMDITELLGVKQVYHSIQGWPEPLQLKSEGLQRVYSHMRHPCFSTLSVILLVHPIMQLDRLFLSCGLLAYMMLFLKVDEIDYAYQKRMLQRKERDLQCE